MALEDPSTASAATAVAHAAPSAGDVAALRSFLARHRQLLVLTGAGCSTGSGIPDYRGDDGAWKRRQPVTWQDFAADEQMRRRYWARSLRGWPLFAQARPNAAHRALARLERAGRLAGLVTQNVDDLHQRAGHQGVIALHGRLDQVHCTACGWRIGRASLQQQLEQANPAWCAGPQASAAPDGDADLERADFSDFVLVDCAHCAGMLKPDVVFFGESVPRDRVLRVDRLLANADAVLVVGSSLQVFSGFRVVRDAVARGLPALAINRGTTRADPLLSRRLAQDCAPLLDAAID